MKYSSLKNNFLNIIIFFFPLTLIAGPAISEIFLLISIIYFFFNKKINILSNRVKNLIIIFLIFYLYILIITSINYNNFRFFKSALFYFRFILFSVSICFIISNINLNSNKFYYYFLFFLFFISLDSIVQFFFGINTLGNELNDHFRPTSFFGEEKKLGSFFFRTLPLLLFFSLYQKILRNNKKIVLILLIGLIIFSTYLSGERTAFFLSCFFLLLITFFVKLFRKIILKASILAIFFIVVTSLVKPYEKDYPFNRMFNKTVNQFYDFNKKIVSNNKLNFDKNKLVDSEKSIQKKKLFLFSKTHQSHFEAGIEIAKKKNSFLFGLGANGFRFSCFNDQEILKKYVCSTHPHNFYIQAFLEGGIVGLIFIVLFFFYICNQILIQLFKNNDNTTKAAKLIILIGLFVFIWPLSPSGNLFTNWINMTLFYPLGIYFYLENND